MQKNVCLRMPLLFNPCLYALTIASPSKVKFDIKQLGSLLIGEANSDVKCMKICFVTRGGH